MLAFRVDDMTCGHCVSTITKTLKTANKDAQVSIDLARHLVQIDAPGTHAQHFSNAISEAGFTPVVVEASGGNSPTVKVGVGGCCCSSSAGGCC